MTPAPFVVGLPRSGTTLLRLMLDAHPELAIPPETHAVPAALAAPDAAAAVAALTAHPRWAELGLGEDAVLAARDAADPAEAVRTVYRRYAAGLGKRRWGDKTPGYLRHMTAIEAGLPEARFIHVVRDGRDVACSIVPLPWGPASHAEAAAWWRDGIAAARAQAPALRGYVEVRFEDLVRRPRDELERVCAAVELPFEAAMLDYHRGAAARMAELDRDLRAPDGRVLVPAATRTAMHRLTTEPPRADRIGAWRETLGDEAAAAFAAQAGDLLRDLGYEPASDASHSSA